MSGDGGGARARVFGVGDRVRVAAITGSAADHVVRMNPARMPAVGDVGTVVLVANRLGGVGRHHTVALHDAEGRPVWLAVFAAHELALAE